MAKEEHPREDLLRDATAYHIRAEWDVPFLHEPVFCGFREPGGPSFYFGQEEVYHLTSGGELRRAFLAGKLLKAERGLLVQLTRQRTETVSNLLRRELSLAETEAVLGQLVARLAEFRRTLEDDTAVLRGEVLPDDAADSATECVLQWLATQPIAGIAASPRSG